MTKLLEVPTPDSVLKFEISDLPFSVQMLRSSMFDISVLDLGASLDLGSWCLVLHKSAAS
jgi:hypothetical protein